MPGFTLNQVGQSMKLTINITIKHNVAAASLMHVFRRGVKSEQVLSDVYILRVSGFVVRPKWFSATWSAAASPPHRPLCHTTQTLRMRPPTSETASCAEAGRTRKKVSVETFDWGTVR